MALKIASGWPSPINASDLPAHVNVKRRRLDAAALEQDLVLRFPGVIHAITGDQMTFVDFGDDAINARNVQPGVPPQSRKIAMRAFGPTIPNLSTARMRKTFSPLRSRATKCHSPRPSAFCVRPRLTWR